MFDEFELIVELSPPGLVEFPFAVSGVVPTKCTFVLPREVVDAVVFVEVLFPPVYTRLAGRKLSPLWFSKHCPQV